MWRNELDDDAYSLKQQLIYRLRAPLLTAIEREFDQALRAANIVVSRGEYIRLKWDVVRAIVGSDE
jgi:hypothetical protein